MQKWLSHRSFQRSLTQGGPSRRTSSQGSSLQPSSSRVVSQRKTAKSCHRIQTTLGSIPDWEAFQEFTVELYDTQVEQITWNMDHHNQHHETAPRHSKPWRYLSRSRLVRDIRLGRRYKDHTTRQVARPPAIWEEIGHQASSPELP